MDKGIRPFCNALFLQTLPTRVNTREGNTAFRKSIIASCMGEFDITLASAATHYNHAFINARELAKTDTNIATLLEGLGRPEDKKGGRKPKAKVEATPAAATDSATLADVASSNLLGNGDEMTGSELLSEGIKENTSTHTVTTNPPAEAAPVVIKYKVRKVSDGTVVCEDLTEDEANKLIAKAIQAKKAKLEMVAA